MRRRRSRGDRRAAPSVGSDCTVHPPPSARISDTDACIWRDSKKLLDAIHRAILSSLGVPLGDRYQVYQEHSESHFIVQDTGLGIDRTKSAIFIGITSRQRTDRQKTNLYTMLVEELKACGIDRTISSSPSLRTPTSTGVSATDARSSSRANSKLDAESIWRHTQRDANWSRFG
jgi:hypothetical protein